jgi:S-sulfo-L-cysteine synthase (3-phospho-L-serine-dependent)
VLLMTATHRPLVASVAGRLVLDVLTEMGVDTVVLDEDIPLEVALQCAVPIETDLDDWEAVEAALRRQHDRRPVDAVLSVRDSYVPLAAYLADRLEVRGLALQAALNCHDKSRMRAALHGAGLPNPRYAVVSDPQETSGVAAAVGFPAIAKLARGAGGAGVRLCRTEEELQAAVTELSELRPGVDLVVEEYLDGPEYAVQTVTVDGRTEVLSVLAEHVGPPPRFAETGYDFPAGLAAADESALLSLVVSALDVLGMDNGIAHVQARLTADGPRIVEVNPRPPGGMLSRVSEVVSGVSLLEAAVSAALGRPVPRRRPAATQVRYRCVVFDQAGRLSYDPAALREDDGTGTAPVVSLDVEPGDLVLPVDHPDGGVYGRIVAWGDTAEDVESQLRTVRAELALRIEPAEDQETTP